MIFPDLKSKPYVISSESKSIYFKLPSSKYIKDA
nr:MAG TPA: hypothetical protein [Bacteriophage sp.]